MIQTPQTRVLFGYTLRRLALGVFAVVVGLFVLASVNLPKTQHVQAASAKTINFQARLLSAGGGIAPDGTYNVEFKLYNSASVVGTPDQGACTRNGGTPEATCLWTETRTGGAKVQVRAGYVSVYLGSVTDLPSNIWNQQLWLTMNIGGTGAPSWDGEMSPRLQLSAVPSAYSLTNYNSATGFYSSLSLSASTGGDQTFTVPDQGAAGAYTLLTTTAANGAYVQFAPGGVQTDSTTNNSIFINKNNATGNILELQKSASDVFTISNAGNITATGTYNTNTFTSSTLQFGAASAATVDSASGQTLQIGTGANAHNLTIGNVTGNTAVTIQAGTGGINIGTGGIANTVQIGTTTGAVAQIINIGNNATGSSTSNINIGSSIAGTTAITGPTTVTNRTSGSSDSLVVSNSTSTGTIARFQDNSTDVFSLADGGAANFQNQTNSSTAFQIQNAVGDQLLNIDTTNSNLITNSSIEVSPLVNWVYSGTAGSVARDTSQSYLGNASLNVITNNGAADGAKQTLATTLSASTTYFISWEDKLSASTFTDVIAQFSYDGTTGHASNCTSINTQTVLTTGWTRHTCQFTTGSGGTAPNSSNAIYIVQTGAAVRTFYIDAVQLQITAATAYNDGRIALNGIVNSPVTFQNSTDSKNAFQIQNSAGTSNLFVADTINGRIGIGKVPVSATLDVNGSIYTSSEIAVSASATNAGQFTKFALAGTGGVTGGDVVVYKNDSGTYRVMDTTTARDPYVYGVAASTASSGGSVGITILGNTTVTYDTGGATPAIGDQLVTSTVAGKVTVDNNATQGILGYATAAGAGGNVSVMVRPVAGQTNPVFKNNSDGTTAFRIQNASGNNYLLVNTSGASVSLGDTSIASTVQIGNTTGAVSQTLNLGTNATSGGTNVIHIGDASTSTDTITIGSSNNASNSLSLESGTGTTGLFNGATAHTLQVATGAAVQSVTIGSTNSTSVTTIQAGANGASTTLALQVASGGVVGLASNGVAQTVNIGNTTGASALNEKVGTGNYTLDGVAGTTYQFGASTVAGTIAIGGTAQTGAITLGQSTDTNTINIGNGASASGKTQTIQIGSGGLASSTTTIALGTGSGTSNITLGSTVAGLTVLQSQGGVKVSTLGASTGTSVALCRDSSSTLLTACPTTGTGVAYVNGGNAFGGGNSTLGNTDTNSLQLITGNTGRINITNGTTIYLGNADNTGVAASPNASVLQGTGNSTAAGAGGAVTFQGGTGNTSGAGGSANITGGTAGATGNGGAVNITSGAGGSGSGNSGNISIDAGTVTSGTKGTVSIATANASAVSIGNTSGTFTVESNATANLFNGATAHTIQLGTGAAVQGITIGSTNSTSALTLQAGTGAINIGNDSVAKTTTVNIGADNTGADLVALGSNNASSTTTIEGGTGAAALQIGNGTTAHGIQIGSNATGDNDILIGGTNTGSTLTLESGTAAGAIQIGNGGTAHGIQIGTGAAAQVVAIGSNNGASALNLKAGTGNFTLDGAAGTTYQFGASTVAGTIAIGGAAQTGALTVGLSTDTNTLNLATGITASGKTQTVNIGTAGAAGSTTAINLGTGSGTSNLIIGSTTAGTTLLQSQGGVKVSTLGASTGTSVVLCRDTSSLLLTSCPTTGTGVAYINGGNAFGGGNSTLGNTDSNSLQLLTGNVGRLNITNGTTIYLGNADNTGVAASPNASTLQGTGNSTATGAGGAVTLQGGTGNTSGAGGLVSITGGTAGSTGVGGGVTITSGAGGSASGNSGNISIDVGGVTSGTKGTLTLGTTNASAVSIGNTAGTFTAESNATANLFNGATAHTVQVATGAAVQTVTVGSTNSTSSLSLQAGTGNLDIGNDSVAKTTTIRMGADATGADLLAVGSNNASSTTTIEGGTAAAAIQIGNGTTAHGIQIGSNATGDNDILIGGTNAGSTLTFEAGTAASAIQIGNGTTAHGIQIGSNATGDNDILLGGNNAGSTVTIDAGTAAGAIAIGNSTTAHGIQIGTNATGSNTIAIGGTNASSTLTFESGTGASAIQIGNGATAHGIQIGTGAAVQTVVIGSTNSTSALSLQAGTGLINIGNDTVAKTTTINVGADNTGADLLALGSNNASSTTTIEGGTAAAAIQIGNGTTAHGIQIGSNATSANAILLGGANAASSLTLEAGTGATGIQIGNGATAHGIQIGTGAAVQTVVIGSTNSTSALTLQAGTGLINIGNDTVAKTTTVNIGADNTGADLVALGSNNASSTTTIDGGTGASAIQIGNTTTAHGIQIGSNATGDNDILIGGTNAGSTLTFEAGTNASAIQIGNGGTAHGIQIGTGANAQVVAIGSNNGASALNLKAGTGNFTLDGAATTTYQLGASTVGGTIAIGGTAQTGALTVGLSTDTNTLNLATGISASGKTQTINVGTAGAAGSTTAINLGTGSGTSTIIVGSTTAGITTLQSQGGVKITTQLAATATSQYLCRDSTTTSLTACNTTGTGAAFINGGNAFGGGNSILGNTDTNSLQIVTNNVGRLNVTNGTTIYLGNADNTGVAASPNASTLQGTGNSTAAGTGGAVSIQGGTGNTTGAGGLLTLQGGTSGATGAGGNVAINGGAVVGGTNAGSTVTITGGTSAGAAAGGLVSLVGGASNATAGSNGGSVAVTGANGSSTGAGGNGGNVTVTAGNGLGSAGNGGNVTLTAGNSTSGTKGSVIVKNVADSNATFQIQNAAGTSTFFNADSSNQRISVGSLGTATAQLYVSGATPSGALQTVALAGSGVQDIKVVGRYAYMIGDINNLLYVYDVSNPASMTAVSNINMNTSGGCTGAGALSIQGHYAYVDCASNKLAIYDISNPASISFVTSITSAGTPNGLYVQGRYAYVVNLSGGLIIYDIGNPSNPVQVGTIATLTGATKAYSIFVQGRYAYIAARATLAVNSLFIMVDVGNPTAPAITNSITLSDTPEITVGSTYFSEGVYVQNDLAFVTVGGSTNAIKLFNVSNPASISAVSTITGTNGPSSVVAQGRYLYVGYYTANRVMAWDISNPASPVQAGSNVAVGDGVGALAVSGRYLYSANYATGSFTSFDMGGVYAQQLEVGGLEAANLNVSGNSNLYGDINIAGGATISQGLQVNDDLAVTGTALIKTGSTAALQIQNATNANLFTVDTTNTAIVLGNDGATNSALTIRGGAQTASNAQGKNITFDASNGTGNGGSGDFIFRTAASGNNAVTYDTSSKADDGAGGTSASYVGVGSITIGANSNRLLVVTVTIQSNQTLNAVTGVVFGGSNLTKLDSQNCPTTNFSPACRQEIWYTVAPATGTHTFTINLSGAGRFSMVATSYYNADQSTPFGTAVKATGATPGNAITNSITATNAQLVYDALAADNTISASTTTGTNVRQIDNQVQMAGQQDKAGTGSSQTFTWTANSSDWADLLMPINPIVNSTPDTLTDRLHIAANGNIGINNASPQYTLDVTGTGNFSTQILAPILDTATATTLSIAHTTATGFTIGGASVAAPVTSTVTGQGNSTAAGTGGALTLQAGAGNTTGAGGVLTLQGGSGGATGAGGAININGGTAGGGTNAGSAITITGGQAAGNAAGGLVTLQGGTASATAGSAGGAVAITARNGSSTGAGGAGGAVTITAGNGLGTGPTSGGSITLQAGSATAGGTAGGVIVKNASNSTGAFQIQNAAGITEINSDTTNTNMISNPSLELNNTGWAGRGSGTVGSPTSSTAYSGTYSLPVTTTALANDGAKFAVALAANTQYTFSVSVASPPGGYMTNVLDIGYSYDGTTGNEVSCLTSATSTTGTGWLRYTCTFMSSASTTGSSYMYIKQTDATARIFYVDAAQLNVFSVLTNANMEIAIAGNWAVKGVTPTTFAQSATFANDYTNSLHVVTQATASQGAKQNVTLTDNTRYFVSFNALIPGGANAFGTLEVGYSSDGSTDNTVCATGVSIYQGWTKVNCSFVTPSSHSGTPYFYIKQTDAVIHDFYIDSVQLVVGGSFPGAYTESSIAINSVVNSNLAVQSGNNSVNALTVQNTIGANLLQVDTLGSNITLLGNNDGETSAWQATSSLQANSNGNRAVVLNGYLYVLRGSQNPSVIDYAKINGDGSLGSFATAATLGARRTHAALVAYNGFIYAYGGTTDSATTKNLTTEFMKQNGDGTLGTVNSGTPMVSGSSWVSDQGGFAANGYLYSVGGNTTGHNQATGSASAIYVSKIFPDGSNGAWTANANSLADAREAEFMAVTNNSITVIGGTKNNASNSDYQYAQINPNTGVIGTFTRNNSTKQLPYTRYNGTSTSPVINGYVYIIGGYINGGAPGKLINYAKIGSDGNINSAWAASSYQLPDRIGSQGGAYSNGYMYNIGGFDQDTGANISAVYYTSTSRLKVAASLDLLGGISGTSLTGPGSGGSITAGNAKFVGTLEVADQASFNSSLYVNGNINAGGINNQGATTNVVTTQTLGASGSITQSLVDNFTAISITASAAGETVTVPAPTDATSGKIYYVSNSPTGSNSVILSPSGGNSFQLNTGATATLLWNGTVWTNAGVDGTSDDTINTQYGGLGAYSNLITYSEQFDNAAWAATNATVSANSVAAPDTNTTADTLVGTGASTLIQTYTTSTTGNYTFSVWLKQLSGAATSGICIFSTSGTPASCTPTVVTPSSTNWQRFTVTTNVTSITANNVKVEILPGNGSTASIYAWGAQLVAGTNPQIYARTLGTNVPVSNGLVSNGTTFTNTGSTINTVLPLGDFPSGGSMGTAPTTVDIYSAIKISQTTTGQTITVQSPTVATPGRVLYISNTGSAAFTLSAGSSSANMGTGTTATLLWNGSSWTFAGTNSSNLQVAYTNTLVSAGGAEILVNATNTGLTIRDDSSNPVNGSLLEIQSANAANLFTVSDNVTDFATNGGAETQGVSSTTFPVSAPTWAASNGGTVSRTVTAGQIATGQGAVKDITTSTTNQGIANALSVGGTATALTTGLKYNVSFSAKLDAASAAFTDLQVYYSVNGSTLSTLCTSGQQVSTSVWTKITCSFTAPVSTTTTNAILIQQAAAAVHTFYVDNLSVTISGSQNYATDGGVDSVTGTNWVTAGAGTVSVSQSTSVGYNASDSAQVQITAGAANAGVRNKLSINPQTSTLYRISTYVTTGTSFTDFKIRYSPDNGSTFVDCTDYNTQTITVSVPLTAWTQVTCYLTTGATAVTNPYVYFVETASATRTYYVDNFNMSLTGSTVPDVQIGSGILGGPLTLFTVDRGASAPIATNNDALLGSMYYDTTLGKLQCYEAKGWGACGSSPDNIITISPEYTNAVLHGTGVGTMTSDLCSDALDINDATHGVSVCGTNETYNFYRWTSPQASAQTYSIYVTYQLPSTFSGFYSGQTSLMGRTDSANSTVQYTIYKNTASGLTACGSTVAVSTGVQSSWQTGTASGSSDPSTCSFAAGNSVVFKIDVIASSNANAYVGNLNFRFTNQ